MHPEVSQLPSKIFYDGKLKDGPDMEKKTHRVWHAHPMFGTYRFLDVADGLEEKSKNSLKNMQECRVAAALYNRLVKEFSSFDFEFKIGIVSMYRAQIVELRRTFERQFGREVLRTVDFNTVDGFQGQEKDVIILSCVRSGPGVQNVGFLSGESIDRYPPTKFNLCQMFDE
jgi:senataxin